MPARSRGTCRAPGIPRSTSRRSRRCATARRGTPADASTVVHVDQPRAGIADLQSTPGTPGSADRPRPPARSANGGTPTTRPATVGGAGRVRRARRAARAAPSRRSPAPAHPRVRETARRPRLPMSNCALPGHVDVDQLIGQPVDRQHQPGAGAAPHRGVDGGAHRVPITEPTTIFRACGRMHKQRLRFRCPVDPAHGRLRRLRADRLVRER